MATQWTAGHPGAGKTGSLRTLEQQLRSVETILDTSLSDLERADDVFGDIWAGLSASLARAQLTSLRNRTESYDAAVTKAKKSLSLYADEVDEIKRLAARQIQIQTTAQDQTEVEFVLNHDAAETPYGGPAWRALESATAELLKLANRRQKADDAVLTDIRAAGATTDTSVKFTVISDKYFDGPGSTIEFSIVEVNGEHALRKTAHAVNANQAAAFGASWAAEQTWNIQTENLKHVVGKYGRK